MQLSLSTFRLIPFFTQPVSVCAGKNDLVGQLLAAKEASGKTFTQISKEIGLTNAFTAQLFHNQVKALAHLFTLITWVETLLDGHVHERRVGFGSCKLLPPAIVERVITRGKFHFSHESGSQDK